MKPTSRLTLLSFLLAIATLNLPSATSATHPPAEEDSTGALSVDQRVARVSDALEKREQMAEQSLMEGAPTGIGAEIASFLNRRGGGGFLNRGGGGGFINRGGGWRNGFRNGGGFFNNRW